MRIVFRCDPAIAEELIRPIPARAALPDWLREMPRVAYSDLHGQKVRTVKQYPPFVDAISHGFIIPLPCDVTVRDGVLSWDWRHPVLTVDAHSRSPISFHVPAQASGTPFYRDAVSIVKFNSFLDDRARAGLLAFCDTSGQPCGLAVPRADGRRRQRPFHGCRNPVSGGVDGSELRRHVAARHACRPMFSGGARGAGSRISDLLARRSRAVRVDRKGPAVPPRRLSPPVSRSKRVLKPPVGCAIDWN